MPRYLFIATYTPQGSKAVLASGGTARRAAIEKMCADAGGRVESFDFAFGTDDVYTIVDLPDARTAAAIALTVNASAAGSTVPRVSSETFLYSAASALRSSK